MTTTTEKIQPPPPLNNTQQHQVFLEHTTESVESSLGELPEHSADDTHHHHHHHHKQHTTSPSPTSPSSSSPKTSHPQNPHPSSPSNHHHPHDSNTTAATAAAAAILPHVHIYSPSEPSDEEDIDEDDRPSSIDGNSPQHVSRRRLHNVVPNNTKMTTTTTTTVEEEEGTPPGEDVELDLSELSKIQSGDAGNANDANAVATADDNDNGNENHNLHHTRKHYHRNIKNNRSSRHYSGRKEESTVKKKTTTKSVGDISERGDALEGLSELVPGLVEELNSKREMLMAAKVAELGEEEEEEEEGGDGEGKGEGGEEEGKAGVEVQQVDGAGGGDGRKVAGVPRAPQLEIGPMDEMQSRNIRNLDSMVAVKSMSKDVYDTVGGGMDDSPDEDDDHDDHDEDGERSLYTSSESSYEEYERERERKEAEAAAAKTKTGAATDQVQSSSSSSSSSSGSNSTSASGSTVARTHSTAPKQDIIDSRIHNSITVEHVLPAVPLTATTHTPPLNRAPPASSSYRSRNQRPFNYIQKARSKSSIITPNKESPPVTGYNDPLPLPSAPPLHPQNPNPREEFTTANHHHSSNVSLSTATQTQASTSLSTHNSTTQMPMCLPNFRPATGCTNASDFIVRCFVARLRSGITVTKHGRSRWCKSRFRILHIHSDGKCLSWKPAKGEPTSSKRPPRLDLTTCIEVRHAWTPDPLNPMFTGTGILRQKCEAAHAFKSFALIFDRRTVDITAVTADQCKVLMEGFSALCFRLQVASKSVAAAAGGEMEGDTCGSSGGGSSGGGSGDGGDGVGGREEGLRGGGGGGSGGGKGEQQARLNGGGGGGSGGNERDGANSMPFGR